MAKFDFAAFALAGLRERVEGDEIRRAEVFSFFARMYRLPKPCSKLILMDLEDRGLIEQHRRGIRFVKEEGEGC